MSENVRETQILKKIPQNCDFMPEDAWRIMRIMAEFVDSFETMRKMPERLVAVFGSARSPEDSPAYREAYEVGQRLGGGHLHLLVDVAGPHVERAPEDARERQHVSAAERNGFRRCLERRQQKGQGKQPEFFHGIPLRIFRVLYS